MGVKMTTQEEEYSLGHGGRVDADTVDGRHLSEIIMEARKYSGGQKSFQLPASYIIFKDGNNTCALNGATGTVKCGSNASEIFNWCYGNLTSGGLIFFKGNFIIESTIYPTDMTSLVGEGISSSVLTAGSSLTGSVIGYSNPSHPTWGLRSLRFANFRINCGSKTVDAIKIKMAYSTMDNLFITGGSPKCDGVGINVTTEGLTDYRGENHINNVFIHSFTRGALWYEPDDSRFSNIDTYSCGNESYSSVVIKGSNNNITNCLFDSSGKNNIEIHAIKNRFSNSRFESSKEDLVKIYVETSSYVSSIQFSNCHFLFKNAIANNTYALIYGYAPSTGRVNALKLDSCVFSNDVASIPKYAILLERDDYCTISNNTFTTAPSTAQVSIDNLWIRTTVRNNPGFNPVGKLATPFETTSGIVGLGGDESAPTSATTYAVSGVDCLITSSGGTVSDITIYDSANNVIESGITSMTMARYLPIGYKIKFTFTVTPTVAVYGN